MKSGHISFVIKKLTIFDSCSKQLRKNLTGNEYTFTTKTDTGFFGYNISVQCIVGMNGSGKSTLLELIFRIINNLAALLFKNMECGAAQTLRYVLGLYADFEYTVRGKNAVIRCRDKCMAFEYDDIRAAFGENCADEFPGFSDYNDASEHGIREITSSLFYTIVSNYSLQAYSARDYMNEECMVYDREQKKWIKDSNESWINSLFHKNDGYMCPINLNPFRDHGIVDMYNEADLSRYRLSALLIEFDRWKEHGREYIHGYRLGRISYKFTREKLMRWLSADSAKETSDQKYKRIMKAFKQACVSDNSPANVILNYFRLGKTEDNDHAILWFAKLYLVCKTLLVASKYPPYAKYSSIGDVENALRDSDSPDRIGLYKSLARHIRNDKSHITIKIRQVRHFIENFKNIPNPDKLYHSFNYNQYSSWTGTRNIERSVYERMNVLPPPIFTFSIILHRSNDKKKHKDDIPLNMLSSGERQFLSTTSAIMYHLINLRSIRKGRPAYRCFNIVLDEVELCFHPEYQRQFVYELLRLVKLVGFMDRCSLNIILTTHSPFILSDIPSSNILYLKDGKQQANDSFVNPFGANISDILRQSFFLENGFMGKFAQRKIQDLICFLINDDGKRNGYDMSLADNLIKTIGDPLLQKHLKRMVEQFKARHHLVDDRMELEILKEKVKQLEQKINNETDTDR